MGKAERRCKDAWNSFAKILGLEEEEEEEVKDSGGLCQDVLKIVLIINQKKNLIWEVVGRSVEQF